MEHTPTYKNNKMTERFKNAVKAFVEDGVLTSEEKNELKKIAKLDNVDDTEAEIYITQELKKKKRKIDKEKSGGGFWNTFGKIITPVITIGGFALTVLTEMDKLPKPKK